MKVPLYCRPIRDLTPEKPNKSPSNVIPGLPLGAQKAALDKRKKVEKDKRNAFEVLKEAQSTLMSNCSAQNQDCSPNLKSNKRGDNELGSPYTPPSNVNKKSKAISVHP